MGNSGCGFLLEFNIAAWIATFRAAHFTDLRSWQLKSLTQLRYSAQPFMTTEISKVMMWLIDVRSWNELFYCRGSQPLVLMQKCNECLSQCWKWRKKLSEEDLVCKIPTFSTFTPWTCFALLSRWPCKYQLWQRKGTIWIVNDLTFLPSAAHLLEQTWTGSQSFNGELNQDEYFYSSTLGLCVTRFNLTQFSAKGRVGRRWLLGFPGWFNAAFYLYSEVGGFNWKVSLGQISEGGWPHVWPSSG